MKTPGDKNDPSKIFKYRDVDGESEEAAEDTACYVDKLFTKQKAAAPFASAAGCRRADLEDPYGMYSNHAHRARYADLLAGSSGFAAPSVGPAHWSD